MRLLSLIFYAGLGLAWQAQALQLESPGLADGATLPQAQVYSGFGCTGDNLSPPLRWSGVPAGTKSLAITLYDPDAPTGSGWWHWVVFNLPATTTELAANAGSSDGKLLPAGAVQGRTDYGVPGFGGACPPEGHPPHRYQLTLFALDIDALPLDGNASAAMVGFYLNAHAIDKATMTWHFGR